MTHRQEELPPIGLGTWPELGGVCAEMVASALKVGYQLIDTAQNYDNEAAVGEGIRRSGISRENVWVASKLRGKYHGEKTSVQAVEESLLRMQLDYFDLYMIHWPNPQRGLYIDTWGGLVEARERGMVRNIGVCNFTTAMLDEVTGATGVAPYVNQIEMHPYWARPQERKEHRERGIRTEAWSPLGRGGELLRERTLVELAEKYRVPVGTLILGWHLSLDVTPLPKSASSVRQQSNFDALALTIAPEDVARIDALNGTRPDKPHADPMTYEQL